jgi:hypothetical protein
VVYVQHQTEVSNYLKIAIEEGLYIIYFDETAFTRTDCRSYGYALRGKKPVFSKNKPFYSIGGLFAISKYRLEGIQLRNGMTNKLAFYHFILELIKTLKYDNIDLKKIVLYLDNATYHTA